MLKRVLNVLLPFTVIIIGLLGTKTVWASDAEYEVKAIPSVKQVDKTKTYFDLRLNPEESQQLVVKVTNTSDKKYTIDTNVQKATTNTNGVVEYMNSAKNQSVKLPYDVSQLVTVDTPKFTLAPRESKNVTYTVKMPEKEFDGLLAGGIVFTSEETDRPDDKTSDVAINNQFGYVIALVLHGKKEVLSELALDKVSLGQVNNRNVVFAHLANPEAAYLNRLNVNAKIRRKNNNNILYETKKSDMQMAPNSVLNYPVSLEETAFKPGKYLLSIHAESKGRTWDFEEEFEIKGKAAKDLNAKAYIHKEKQNYWWYVILLGILLLLILLIIIYRKRQQRIKELEQQVEELKKN